ncbi:hypothetical protein PMAYCL1PPCAC_10101, partial [Pristionchus mayeri]
QKADDLVGEEEMVEAESEQSEATDDSAVEQEQAPRPPPVVLNEEPLAIPFDAEIFHILLRCQKEPGLEDIYLYNACFETRAILLKLAEYLNMPDRIEFFARSMTELVEGKNVEEMAAIIGITRDIVPEEFNARFNAQPQHRSARRSRFF